MLFRCVSMNAISGVLTKQKGFVEKNRLCVFVLILFDSKAEEERRM